MKSFHEQLRDARRTVGGCTCRPVPSSETFGEVVWFMPPVAGYLQRDGSRLWRCGGCGAEWVEL